MATPYLQKKIDEVGSTQDFARAELDEIPVLVIAQRQTEGRGRSGSVWENAPRALAVSLAVRLQPDEKRPLSLMAGVAATRAVEEVVLKWPNDLILGGAKVGGILVELSHGLAVVGLGLNLWWPGAPEGYGQIYDSDPGDDRHVQVGALWGAEMMRLLDAPGWPADEYRHRCVTVGRRIAWEPEGSGTAVGVADTGELLVDVDGETIPIRSGAVAHVREV